MSTSAERVARLKAKGTGDGELGDSFGRAACLKAAEEAAAPPKATAPTTITVEGRTIKRLTQAEQEERRRLGLCYNCDEKFTQGHNRICKRLFLPEGIEEDDSVSAAEVPEDGEAEESPVFSLQALADVTFADTMQIPVTLGTTSLVALLDSGSTHSFISEATTHRSGLPVQR